MLRHSMAALGVAAAILGGCMQTAGSSGRAASGVTELREELLQVDRAFSDMAQRQGVDAAFLAYAADDAILMQQDDVPAVGIDAIRRIYAEPMSYGLEWRPTKAEVAASGDLGYTFGEYRLWSKRKEQVEMHGVYVTVWRWEPNGGWRYVLDGGVTTPDSGKPWP